MKKAKIIFWVSTVFIFLFEGIMPISTLLFAPQYTNAGTKPLGYPDYFAVALIILKFSGALAILLPPIPDRLKEWAYAGLTFNLVFAIISHAVVDGNIGFILLPVGVMAVLALSYFNRNKMQIAKSERKEDGVVMRESIA
ncbi:DoxX family protein [Chitinophaga sp. ARDCPP14]|uniref:DoxX family protein n=1 Tax=Chitinophaga sp. ARDCPP14 TaxID=3391139 RepID=UPI003F51DF64